MRARIYEKKTHSVYPLFMTKTVGDTKFNFMRFLCNDCESRIKIFFLIKINR